MWRISWNTFPTTIIFKSLPLSRQAFVFRVPKGSLVRGRLWCGAYLWFTFSGDCPNTPAKSAYNKQAKGENYEEKVAQSIPSADIDTDNIKNNRCDGKQRNRQKFDKSLLGFKAKQKL